MWLSVLILVVLGTTDPADRLVFEDDLGAPIRENLELCFHVGTEQICRSVAGQEPVSFDRASVEGFHIEGPEHGPTVVRTAELKDRSGDPTGAWRIVLTRKADLLIDGVGADEPSMTVSLYSADDQIFRRPKFRIQAKKNPLKIPAGRFVASLFRGGQAPDLHFLDAPPGSERALTYRARDGWSLVLRAVDPASGDPLANVRTEVSAASGFEGEKTAPLSVAPRSAITDGQGLALISGLSFELATATLTQPGRFDGRVEAISARPGTFDFHEVQLARGGTMPARVTLEQEPVVGARCKWMEFPVGRGATPVTLAASKSNRNGTCRSGRLPAGDYTLRIEPRETGSRMDRSVQVVEGEETTVLVDLQPLSVGGVVRVGDEPAPGYRIQVRDRDDPKPQGKEEGTVASAVTDEDGAYAVDLWQEGRYVVLVSGPGGGPISFETVTLVGPETVDFFLGEHSLEGTVVDDQDQPVPAATLLFKWRGRSRKTTSDEQGTFRFSLEKDPDGEAVLQAQKSGYHPSARKKLEMHAGTAPPILNITLNRMRSGAGTLRSAGGAPVAGGWIMAYKPHEVGVPLGGRRLFVGNTFTDAEGYFEVALAEGPTRLFFGGPGCPLATLEITPTERPMELVCSASMAHLSVRLEGADGAGRAGMGVFLRSRGIIFPEPVVEQHLQALGLPAYSDRAGRLALVALAPGPYDLFLRGQTSAANLYEGFESGYLSSVVLSPSQTLDVSLTLEDP